MSDAAVPQIAPSELAERLADGRDIRLIDIRDEAAYEDWHIPESTNIPVYEAVKKGDADRLDSLIEEFSDASEVVTICYAGVVSQDAARWLRDRGVSARSLEGGMNFGWSTVWSEARLEANAPEGTGLLQIRRNAKGCLSYLIGSEGSAIVVDPNVAPETYLTLAEREGWAITGVWETHIHADHVSRARALAERTGAVLRLPEQARDRVTFGFEPLLDREQVDLGRVTIQALATPGHTRESMSYRLSGFTDGVPRLLTGDTLFADGVGRPDLEAGEAGARDGAAALYEALGELSALPEATVVLPAHHGGPIGFDGRPIAASLGQLQRELAWTQRSREAFITGILDALAPKPPNFERIMAVNEGRLRLADAEEMTALEAGPNRCAA